MLLSVDAESSTVTSSSTSSSFLPLSQQVYLTSEAYIGQKTSSRAEMWSNLLEENQSSGRCDGTYKTGLKWNGSQTARPDLFPSHMQVEYSNSGEMETALGCALVLLLAITANPDVCSVDVQRSVKTHNLIANYLTESEIEDVTPFQEEGIDGTGEVVAISDSGVDIDNCYFYDPNTNKNGPVGSPTGPGPLVDLSFRKVVQYVAYADSGDPSNGHGTHVAGTIAGKRFDEEGAADGIASGAKLAVLDVPPVAIFHRIYTSGYYTSRDRDFDQFMYENDEFLAIVAAGNAGDDGGLDVPKTVGSPANSKNGIGVGATMSWGSSLPNRGYGPSFVTYFSSRGPTADGRMKPDLMAPGNKMLSAGARPNEQGECDSDLKYSAGTSMAAPVVSGTAAKIRQYFRQGYYPSGEKNSDDAYPNPSGGLLKAVLLNGAQALLGVDNVIRGGGVTPSAPYDNNQGFGRLSLQDSVYLAGKTNVQLKIWDRESVPNGGTNTYDVTIDKSGGCQSKDLSVTLVWMEEGSPSGCTACVLHDLDLSVSFRV
ncbi:subtilase family serine peptidase [Skeletonema marinoi]|uniref:subtilisin n=1 Tax=Skeletonema marinoi TaxID=267567 RepID=A0AAD8XUR8_9STRA|nr:subtilase family serine peptidase [Skeletonema marinoi]